jgi:hypothetical protein
MVNSILLKNEDELREFYEWLLYRAKEKESKGNKDQGLLYEEYAELIKEKIDSPRCCHPYNFSLCSVSTTSCNGLSFRRDFRIHEESLDDAGEKSSVMMRSVWSGIGFNKLLERLHRTHASLKQGVSDRTEALRQAKKQLKLELTDRK